MTTTPPSTAENPFASSAFSAHEDGFGNAPLEPEAQRNMWILLGVFALACVAAYWNMLSRTAAYWNDPLYSHGWIVPAFAAYLFWMRRKPLTKCRAPNGGLAWELLPLACYFELTRPISTMLLWIASLSWAYWSDCAKWPVATTSCVGPVGLSCFWFSCS